MFRLSSLALCLPLIALAACKPPPTDETRARFPLDGQRDGPSQPIDSPDSSNAIWADSKTPGRIIYGNPGEAPMLALACVEEAGTPMLQITRYAPADEGAGALMALIGNAHIERLPVDAVEAAPEAYLWEGSYPASAPALEVLTGRREVSLTIPGAGKLTLNPSERPRMLIESCRGDQKEDAEIVSEGAEPAL
ncbi:hypothetical protein [Altererythrobacter sp.]|uniref:hypothetical protein n=1 Tax=Altererythrobacter sp. TaxID=1872480 RepID=UPI003D095538